MEAIRTLSTIVLTYFFEPWCPLKEVEKQRCTIGATQAYVKSFLGSFIKRLPNGKRRVDGARGSGFVRISQGMCENNGDQTEIFWRMAKL
jgi:hypothetical protein